MPANNAGYTVRVWLSSDDLELMKKLSERTELSQTEIMTRLLHAGIKAIEKNNFRFSLPLVFQVAPDGYNGENHTEEKKINRLESTRVRAR